MSRSPRYVEGAALVAGFAAHVIDRVLARHLPALLQWTQLSADQRQALEETRTAIARAADLHAQQSTSATETPVAEIGPTSPHDEMSTAEAAAELGVTQRRVCQLAEGGLGRKVGRVWVLDRAAVLAYSDEHRSRSA